MSRLDPTGPVVVAIGGGHGLARTLGAARRYASSITAIVSVADDGGSSGRLRESLGIPAPGDLRRCFVALLSEPGALSETLEYRFDAGELEGHALGNLLLAALFVTTHDAVGATLEAGRLLGTVGRVLPATANPVNLIATSKEGEVTGQVHVMAASGIERVFLDPPSPAPPEVLDAIAAADQIVIGPGSLYTSVLAALGAGGVSEAVSVSSANVVYVCNLREQVPETRGYDVAAHLDALIAHGVSPDVVICDSSLMALGAAPLEAKVVATTLTGSSPLMHDEGLLAAALRQLC